MTGAFYRDERGFAILELLLSIVILGAVLGTVYLVYFQSRRNFDGLSRWGKGVQMRSALVERIRWDLSGLRDPTVPLLSAEESGKRSEGGEVLLQFVSILDRGANAAPYVVTYSLRRETGETSAILRRERSLLEEKDPLSNETRLLTGVRETKVETYYGREWSPGWPSGRLPRLLRLSLSFQEVGGNEAVFVFEVPAEQRQEGQK
jgi:type II secretory pathway component PulJ